MKKYNSILAVLLLCAVFASPFAGVADISYDNIFDPSSADALIFWQLRLPRTLLAVFVGGILALSGMLFQSIFRNPLMSPFTMGISSAATLGAAIAIYFGFSISLFGFSAVTLFAFFTALFGVVLLALLYTKARLGSGSLLLFGVAMSHFYTALILVIYYVGGLMQTHSIVRFTLGNLSTTGYYELIPSVIFGILLLLSAFYFAPELRLLGVSEENAKLKGVNTKKVVFVILFAVSLAVAAAVSVAGPIGFVGLIVPHILKRLFARPASQMIATNFFGGALFLLLCDMLSRITPSETEIPIGVITAFFGAPFFVYLILTKNK
jgi:iron complex transport system permease protein